MKNTIWIYPFALLFVMGCSQKQAVTPVPVPPSNENVAVLKPQFHGKYELVSSVSSEPIDVNLDGVSSVNMVQEYDYLNEYQAELLINGPTTPPYNPNFLFVQEWPEQYIHTPTGESWQGEFIDYSPTRIVNLTHQGAGWRFEFSPDVKAILVKPNATENPFRWLRPKSVMVGESDTITAVNKRIIYTRAGVKEVTITTVYKRFTTQT